MRFVVFYFIIFKMLIFLIDHSLPFERDEDERRLAFPNVKTVNFRENTDTLYFCILLLVMRMYCVILRLDSFDWLLQCEGIKGK